MLFKHLRIVEPFIDASERHELIVRAALEYALAFYDDYFVGVPDG